MIQYSVTFLSALLMLTFYSCKTTDEADSDLMQQDTTPKVEIEQSILRSMHDGLEESARVSAKWKEQVTFARHEQGAARQQRLKKLAAEIWTVSGLVGEVLVRMETKLGSPNSDEPTAGSVPRANFLEQLTLITRLGREQLKDFSVAVAAFGVQLGAGNLTEEQYSEVLSTSEAVAGSISQAFATVKSWISGPPKDCVGALTKARLRQHIKTHIAEKACEQADQTCVVTVGKYGRFVRDHEIRLVCAKDINPSCVTSLVRALPYSPTYKNFTRACKDAETGCILAFARSNPRIEAAQAAEACNIDGNHECVARLIPLRSSWSRGSAYRSACDGADTNCVISLATERSTMGVRELNRSCSVPQ